MATLCGAERLNKQVAHMLRKGMGDGLIDIGSAVALLEAGGECCCAEDDEREAA